ncbi:MAG: hypothetical protein JXA20_10410 [Spirochaetes bacterium]|nr:hypothetical protein [Spirochaetota bacterium]
MDRSLKARDIAYLHDSVLKAGKKALTVQRKGVSVRRKEDASIVTQADTMVQEYLATRILRRFGEVNFVCEEESDLPRKQLTPETITAIIDPVDGTSMFSMYMPIWCVSLGIYLGYRPLYGFVYAPGMDMFFHNDDDAAYVNRRRVRVMTQFTIDSETNIFYATEIYRRLLITFPGKARNLGSTALHACLTVDNARNRTLAFIGKSYIWDWGGAIPVILKAGGGLRYLDGSHFDFREVAENGYILPDYLLAYTYHDFSAVRSIFSPHQ